MIELHEVLFDQTFELGEDPGLDKDGVEAELQELIAARVEALRAGLKLVRREYPTDLGPVDLLCRDDEGRAVVVEIKRDRRDRRRRPAAALPGAPRPRRHARADPRDVRGDEDQAAGQASTPRAAASSAWKSTSKTLRAGAPPTSALF